MACFPLPAGLTQLRAAGCPRVHPRAQLLGPSGWLRARFSHPHLRLLAWSLSPLTGCTPTSSILSSPAVPFLLPTKFPSRSLPRSTGAEVANVHNKAELLDYLRRRERQGEGYAALGELADAYPGARQDLEVGCNRCLHPRALCASLGG